MENENLVTLSDFNKMIQEYKKTGNETIELKVNVVSDILKIAFEEQMKSLLLNVQKANLIQKMTEIGVSTEEIQELLKKSIDGGNANGNFSKNEETNQ